jgi:hypothetical protein
VVYPLEQPAALISALNSPHDKSADKRQSLETKLISRGTESSNPPPSSGESVSRGISPSHSRRLGTRSATGNARGTESLRTPRWREKDSNHRSLSRVEGRKGLTSWPSRTCRGSMPSSAAPSRSRAVARAKATATWNSPSCASSVTRRWPVATTVHDLQVVDSVPRDPTDQPLSVIATPTHAIRIKRPSAAPTGIDWTRLSAEDLEEMPILAELKRMTTSNA